MPKKQRRVKYVLYIVYSIKADASYWEMDPRFSDFVHSISKPGVSRDVLILLINDFIKEYPGDDCILLIIL